MKNKVLAALLATTALLSLDSHAREAAQPAKLKVALGGVHDGSRIPAKMAYCMPDSKGATKDGGNINPSVSWSKGPAETKSYVLLAVDPDVPASFDNANKEGKIIEKDAARQDFYHWVLSDIPANIKHIPQGKVSKGVIKDGLPIGKTPYGITGKNDYATFQGGTHGGYDGPCPPWNDERLHHYHFTVYALDVKTLGLKDGFTGKDVVSAMTGHIVGKGEAVGTYTNNVVGVKP